MLPLIYAQPSQLDYTFTVILWMSSVNVFRIFFGLYTPCDFYDLKILKRSLRFESPRFEGWIFLSLQVEKGRETYSVESGRPSYFCRDVCTRLRQSKTVLFIPLTISCHYKLEIPISTVHCKWHDMSYYLSTDPRVVSRCFRRLITTTNKKMYENIYRGWLIDTTLRTAKRKANSDSRWVCKSAKHELT